MAKFKAAAVFSSNMVLQRDKNINVFGSGKTGENVIVSINGNTVSTKIKDEKWTAILPPMQAGGPFEMKISDGDSTIVFYNVMLGEVWLAGGQSNMELELQNCKNGKDVLATDKDTNVRFYYTQKQCFMDEKFYINEENTGWSEFNEESAKAWSAVGYFFARDLAKRLGVTVGIIGCNWGGTSASAWMSRESLEKDIDLKTYLDEYESAIAGKTLEEMCKEYREYQAYDKAWFEKSQIFYGENPEGSWDDCIKFCGENKYPGPLGPMNPFHATALYESMIKRVCPYTIKGFIYYQGESDDHKPQMYEKLFKGLIQLWRDDWGDNELPFLMVQLPMHRYKADPDYKHWCLIREAQMRTFQSVKNTGIAVILDCGEFNEIHPKEKVPVGERLALQAMYNVYGDKNIDAFGPIYKSLEYINNGIKLSFSHSENGFEIKGDKGIVGFEIAGDDENYVAANAEIQGSSICISSDEVKTPLYARYCWTNYGDVCVFGKNGIPMAPFRTHR